jgi:hypothetical protein
MRLPAIDPKLALIGAGLIVGGYLLWKATQVAKGIVTNDNALTRSATDANGNAVTAYKETTVPVVGTLGAAANAASGGYLASFGEWLGNTTFDVLHPHAFDNNPTLLKPVESQTATSYWPDAGSVTDPMTGVPLN